jgi:hypothetical protein
MGDGDQGHFGKPAVERLKVGLVLAPVQRCDRATRNVSENWKVQAIQVKVQDIELGGRAAHFVQHQHVVVARIAHGRVEPQGLRAARNESGGRFRVAACEERHIVAPRNELVGEIGDDPLGTAIETGWDAFDERRNLGDPHRLPLLSGPRGAMANFAFKALRRSTDEALSASGLFAACSITVSPSVRNEHGVTRLQLTLSSHAIGASRQADGVMLVVLHSCEGGLDAYVSHIQTLRDIAGHTVIAEHQDSIVDGMAMTCSLAFSKDRDAAYGLDDRTGHRGLADTLDQQVALRV